MAEKDVKLASIVRALKEKTTPKKVEDRLSRMLSSEGLERGLHDVIAAERPRPRVLAGERQIAHERGQAGDRRVFPCRSPPMVLRVASCCVFVFFRVAKRFRVSRPNGSGGCGDAAARRRRPPSLNASRGGSQSARRGLQPQSTAHRRSGGAARSGANFRGSARRARPLRPLTHGFNRQARVFYPTWKIRDKGLLCTRSSRFFGIIYPDFSQTPENTGRKTFSGRPRRGRDFFPARPKVREMRAFRVFRAYCSSCP